MVLQGLRFPSWLGWLTGIYYVKRPWGIPEFTGWCHIYTLYSIFINVSMQAFWFDFQLKTTDIVKSSSLTMQLLAKAMIIGNSIFDFYFRVAFGFLKGKVPAFLEKLEDPDLRVSHSYLLCWRFQRVFMWVMIVPRFLGLVVFTLWFQRIVSEDGYFIISSPWYFMVFFVSAGIPAVSSVIFAYDFVLVATFHIVRIFENFCGSLEHHILKINESAISPSCSILALAEEMDDEDIVKSPQPAEKGNFYLTNPREIFIESFEKVKELFAMYDSIIGIFILGLMMRSVFIIIHSINALLLSSKAESELKYCYDFLNLVSEVPQLLLLKIGDTAHEKMRKTKEHLHKMAILLPKSPEKDEVMEIVNFVMQWQWKMTACNFFTISSELMAGIVTTTMSYVVILFQLHLSESSPTNSNTSSADYQQSIFT